MIAHPLFSFCPQHAFLFVAEPINVLSMVPMFIIGVLVFKKAKTLSLIIIYIAFASALMHAVNNPLTRVLDGSSMLLLLLYISLLKQSKISILLVFSLLFVLFNPSIALVIFISSWIYLILTEFFKLKSKKRQTKKYFYLFLVAQIAAISFWLLDITRTYCFAGHALWHIFMGFSLWLLYRYFFVK